MIGVICECGEKIYFKQPIKENEINPIITCTKCNRLYMPNYSYINNAVILIYPKDKDFYWIKYENTF